MFGSAWVVGVVINFTSNGAMTMSRLASQTRLANASLGAQQGIISKNQLAMMRYQERMEALHGAALRFGTAMSAAFAVAGVAVMTSAVTEAAKLQTALVGIQNATGANQSQMSRIQQTAYNISAATAQSVVDSAHIMAVMARSGVNDPNKLMQIALPAAKFADVQFLSRGVSFQEGAQQAIMLAHMFRQYDPKGLTNIFDMMTRLSELMPHNLSAAVTQMGYYLPTFKSIGVSDEQSIATMALLDRFGYGRGKGGTGMANLALEALGPLQMTAHAQVGKANILREMGLIDSAGHSVFYDPKTKNFNFIGFLTQLSDYAKGKRGDDVTKQFISVFGKQGGRMAMLAEDPKFVAQITAIMKTMNRKDLGMDQQQGRYMNTLAGQFQLAVTNFKSVMVELAYPWLGKLTEVFRTLGNSLHSFQVWLHQHPTAEKAIGAGFAGATVAAGGLAVAGASQLALRALGFSGLGGLLSGSGGILTGIMGFVRTFSLSVSLLFPWVARLAAFGIRFVPIVGWIITAIEVFRHASDIAWILGKITGFMQYKLWPGIVNAWQTGISALGSAIQTMIKNMIGGIQSFLANPQAASDNFQKAKDAWWANLAKTFSDARQSEAPPVTHTTHVTVNVRGGGDGKKTGQAVVHELRKAGVIRNGAVTGGHAIPATH